MWSKRSGRHMAGPKPTLTDMSTSLEDARFFYDKIDAIARGPEEKQDLEFVRRYFRGYLSCWKSILHFVREVKGLKNDGQWIRWCQSFQNAQISDTADREVFDCLRETRDHDTHSGMIAVERQIALGLHPVVMFYPQSKGSQGAPRELTSCCERGLEVAGCVIRNYPQVT